MLNYPAEEWLWVPASTELNWGDVLEMAEGVYAW